MVEDEPKIIGWTSLSRDFLTVLALASALSLALRAFPSPAIETPPILLSVEVNSAPGAVLDTLPGLGPVLAGRIVEARPFRSIEEIDRRVKGIGPAKAAALRPYLRFATSTPPSP